MINHGLALYKPGESDLGTAIRLWLVNRHTWKRFASSFDDRINDGKVIQDSLYTALNIDRSNNLYSLRCTHAKLLGYDVPVKASNRLLAQFRHRRRQCQSCAKLGHHSILFDLPWVKICPIHEEPLTKHCPICNQNWPSISQLSTRACDLCGANLNLEDLLCEDAFNTETYIEKIPDLLAFFCIEIQLYQPLRKYFTNFGSSREDALSRVNALPAVLSCYSRDQSIYSQLEKLGVEISKCYKKSFEPAPISDDKDLKLDIGLMERCRKLIFKLSLKVLLREAGHEIGSCPKDSRYGHFICAHCEAWRVLHEGFRKTLNDRDDKILIRYSPPYTRAINVPDPGLITRLYDIATASYYTVPRDIQTIIYCTELWQCVVRLFSQIEFYLDMGPITGSERLPLCEPKANYLDHDKHHFTPLYFVKTDQESQLIFPAEFSLRQLDGAGIQLARFTEETDA